MSGVVDVVQSSQTLQHTEDRLLFTFAPDVGAILIRSKAPFLQLALLIKLPYIRNSTTPWEPNLYLKVAFIIQFKSKSHQDGPCGNTLLKPEWPECKGHVATCMWSWSVNWRRMIYHVLAASIHTCNIDNLRPTPETIWSMRVQKWPWVSNHLWVQQNLLHRGRLPLLSQYL